MAQDIDLTLAADFPRVRREEWLKLVEGALKGAPFEKRLVSKTYDGLVIQPLYSPESASRPLAARPGGAPWQVLQRVDHPDPAVANAEALHDLENGATGLVLVFAGAVGANGYGISPDKAALAKVLDGVQLNAGFSLELQISPPARDGAAHLAAIVKESGYAPDATDIRFGFDPIGALATGWGIPPWPEIAPHLASMVKDSGGTGIPRPVRRGRRTRRPQRGRIGNPGACLCARRGGCIFAGVRSSRDDDRSGTASDLLPIVGGCRPDHVDRQVPRRTEAVGAR